MEILLARIVAAASLFLLLRGQQDGCQLIQPIDLGGVDEYSPVGLIPQLLQSGEGATPEVFVQSTAENLASNTFCLASGGTPDTYSGVSVVVDFVVLNPNNPMEFNVTTSQFDFECDDGAWSRFVAGITQEVRITPPDVSPTTELLTNCSQCISFRRDGFADISNNDQHCRRKYNYSDI